MADKPVKISVFLPPSIHKLAKKRAESRKLSLTRHAADLITQDLTAKKA